MDNKERLHRMYVEVFPQEIEDPKEIEVIWILSTGRCATLTMSVLLHACENVTCFHEPIPRLKHHFTKALKKEAGGIDLLDLVYSARIDLTSTVKAFGYIYAEAGHQTTPFAYEIKQIYPRAKFIWLERDRDSFIDSAIRWGWYNSDDKYIKYRPFYKLVGSVPRETILEKHWELVSNFINDFVNAQAREDWCYVDFQRVKDKDLKDLFRQLVKWGVVKPPTEDMIQQILEVKLNAGPPGPKNYF
ncbi:MAG: hypothetical protein JRD68_00045 [Deltaproteobacteria bacterium]|nr:hypothetical protein [Deltaproteobacteria bacterium]